MVFIRLLEDFGSLFWDTGNIYLGIQMYIFKLFILFLCMYMFVCTCVYVLSGGLNRAWGFLEPQFLRLCRKYEVAVLYYQLISP